MTGPMTYPNRHPAIPGPRGYPPLGVFPRLRRDPLRYLTEAACQYGEVVSLPLGVRQAYLLAHPAHIQHVLQDQPDGYQKGAGIARIKPLFGDGLTTSEGALWRRQRRLMQPLFQGRRLLPRTDVITEATAAMLARWEPFAAHGQPLDLRAALRDLTQGIMRHLLFGPASGPDALAAGQALTQAVEQLDRRVWAALPPPLWLPTRHSRQFLQARRTLSAYVHRCITERRRPGPATDDLLMRLCAARDETTGEGMSATQLHDEAVTLWVAGHTTVAEALVWTCSLLAQHPEAEHALQEELAAVLGGGRPTSRDLPRLRYTRLVIEEVLRLYPPTWVTARTPPADQELGGHRIPARSVLLLSPYVLQRHPAFWEHPERFDPERFTPGRAPDRPRFAYFPFGGGPRRCIGQSLAMLEMQVILAMVAQAYELRFVPGPLLEPEARLTLRPRHRVLVTLRHRRHSSSEAEHTAR
jgi:cytochrome P450